MLFQSKNGVSGSVIKPLRQELLYIGINLNTASSIEHVAEVERKNRILKELNLACYHTLPFKAITKLTMIDLVNNYELRLNTLPYKGLVYRTFISHKLITGIKFDYNTHFKIHFGSNFQNY